MDEQRYFAAQERKSDRKVDWEYRRLLQMGAIELQSGRRVLDAGCGAGPGLRFFASQGALTDGVDQSFYALQRAHELAPGARLIQSDLRTGLPFASESFDLVILGDVIEHVQTALQLLRECHRVLASNGALLVRTVNRWDVRRFWQGRRWSGVADPTHVHLYSPPEMRHVLHQAGFTHVRVRTGIKPVFWLPLRLLLGLPWPPLIGNGLVGVGWKDELEQHGAV